MKRSEGPAFHPEMPGKHLLPSSECAPQTTPRVLPSHMMALELALSSHAQKSRMLKRQDFVGWLKLDTVEVFTPRKSASTPLPPRASCQRYVSPPVSVPTRGLCGTQTRAGTEKELASEPHSCPVF